MRLLRRILLILVIALLIIGAAGVGLITYTTRRMLPQYSGTLNLPGLNGKVTIARDAEGIPQIYATTVHDLFFAQGYVQAQDRWWQMEFGRHTGLGRVSELIGNNPTALASDIFIRTAGWNRAAKADLDHVSPGTLSALNAFSDGINAYIGGKSGPDLAFEYSVLAVKGVNIPIEKWEPLDTVAYGKALAWYLGGNMTAELDRVDLYKKVGQDFTDTFYAPPYPFDSHATILNADDLPGKMAAAATIDSDAAAWRDVQTTLVGGLDPRQSFLFGHDRGVGSNNWVISGKLTTTGKPILANDPHIAIQMPAIWYEIGLHCVAVSDACPYDVEGFTFPEAPGIVIGHNARIAWGVTNNGPDVQDLYTIKVDPNDDTKYELDGKTESMQVLTETIRFGDSTPAKDIRVRVTHFGPIVTDASSFAKRSDKPLALHWTALSGQSTLQDAILAIDQAKDWNSFRAALHFWDVPSQNFVYADVDGNIGYQMPGTVPIRAKDHSGLLPADGSTTQNDWKGYVPFDDLPSVENPARGYIVTANNAVVPEGYYTWLAGQLGSQYGADSNYVFARDWDSGYRAQRITDLVKATDKHSIDTIKAIQADDLNLAAKDILPYALTLDYGTDIPGDVITWMRGWDFHEPATNGQAALYETFVAQLSTQVWQARINDIPGGTNIDLGLTQLLKQPDSSLWDDPATKDKQEKRDDIVRKVFVNAYQTVSKRLGADYKTWKWGDLHQATWSSSPLGVSGVSLIENYVNLGPLPLGGSNETVSVAHWDWSDPYAVTGSISSMRMIVDLNDLNNSQWIIPTGESGHPASDHYRDLNAKYRAYQYDLMPWNADSIQKTAAATLILQPQ
jgi:penicillin amidase